MRDIQQKYGRCFDSALLWKSKWGNFLGRKVSLGFNIRFLNIREKNKKGLQFTQKIVNTYFQGKFSILVNMSSINNHYKLFQN